MTSDPLHLITSLEQARREIVFKMARQLIADPERTLPDLYLLERLAMISSALAAVEAVRSE